jgi:hypothetical protein
MVVYEMLAIPQRDISPELAAAQLRELQGNHYLDLPVREKLTGHKVRGCFSTPRFPKSVRYLTPILVHPGGVTPNHRPLAYESSSV